MPGPALHHLLAGDLHARWEAAPLHAPFAPSAETRAALLHGALGPDMGYFPGADPLLSELAHHARTGAFCRALVAEAETDAERAFAWGWVTHVLADIAVHPLVNDACGELLLGRRTPLWGPAVSAAHMRVETGLDAAVHARHPARSAVRALPPLDPAVLAGMRRAYLRTFGAAPPAEALVDAHRSVTRLLGPSARLRGLAVRAAGGSRLARAGLRTCALLSARGSHAEGLFSPLAPAAWLMDEVEGIVEGFADWFGAHYGSDLRFLRDHCLDSGEPHDGDPPCARAAIAALHARVPARPLLRAA